MTFLPIVDRELRVSARRRGTFLMRAAIALGAMIIGGCIFLANFDKPEPVIGPHIFLGLSILAFSYCLLAGRMLTVNCLTEEKREGTLGLLFLTDLKGHDVVLGKLAATSVNAFFSLLALLPVLALTLLMGGTSNGQFWRMALALVTTFLFSLSLGIYSSATYRTIRGAAAANLLLLVFFVGVLPAVFMAIAMTLFGPISFSVAPLFALCTSPIFTFVMALDACYAFHPASFWCSAGVINCLTCVLVYRAGRVLPRSWQDRVAVQPAATSPRKSRQTITACEAAKRAAYRHRLLNKNPFCWLALRNPRKPLYVWIFLGFGFAWWLWGLASAGSYWFDIEVKITTFVILNTTLKLWIALEAGNQLAHDKRSGTLELLLSSPLTVRDILRGQWQALRRQFLAPLVVVIAFEIFFFRTIVSGTPNYDHSQLFLFTAAGLIMLVADILALGWVAMYLALITRSPAMAGGLTIIRVLVLPWLVLGANALFLTVSAAMANHEGPNWKFYLALWFLLGALADAVFGFGAWLRVRANFRRLAVERFSGLKQPA